MQSKSLFFTALYLAFINNLECKDKCQETYLADLKLINCKSTFDHAEIGKEYYSISLNIINSVDDIKGCESNVQTASPSQFLQRITYSDNPDFNNSIQIDSTLFNLNSLAPGITGSVNILLAFLQDGYYLFQHNVDYLNFVKERNEENNDDVCIFERTTYPPSNGIIIHIQNSGKQQVIDLDEIRIYYKRISTTIKYE